MRQILVSIITNFYNAENFLTETCESVLNQTNKNWELILIDDGSTDKSTFIAKQFVERYPDKFIYVAHKDQQNKGTSASRNLGIKNASGELITFLDADDIYLPNRIEEQVKIINQHPEVDAVFGGTRYWFSWKDKNLIFRDYTQTLEVSKGIYKPPHLLNLMLTKRAAVPCMGALMVKKEIIKTGCWFDEDFTGMYDDQVFYSKIILNSKVFVDNNFYDLYRQHKDSCYSQAKISNSILEYEKIFLKWLHSFVSINYPHYNRLLKTIKKQLWLINYPGIYTFYRKINKARRIISNGKLQNNNSMIMH